MAAIKRSKKLTGMDRDCQDKERQRIKNLKKAVLFDSISPYSFCFYPDNLCPSLFDFGFDETGDSLSLVTLNGRAAARPA
jgi:hypothetical protein